MKVLVVLLSLSTVALASLEPAGYRPPGSSSSTSQQYLPPHLQQQHDHDHEHLHHHQSQPNNPSSQYLPPSYSRPAAPAVPVNPTSQYLPPRARQQQPQQQQRRPTVPSTNYLPAADKPHSPVGLTPPSPPANDYLPPRAPSAAQPQVPSNDYLPPLTRPQATGAPALANDYLPPSRPTPAVPANDYLPPLKSSPKPTAPPKTEYLPPKNDYLPPSTRQSSSSVNKLIAPTTPVPRISIVSVSPYKLDGPAYTKPQSQQPKYRGASSGLATSASSSPIRSSSGGAGAGVGYPQAAGSGYPSGAPVAAVKSFEQPADNYLPPLEGGSSSLASQGYDDNAQDGYRYGARAEQTTEPAKYEFEYRVSDEFGNDFGHKESRSGAQTQGVYSVLLPDGRRQIVRYEADENGFKPRISYEEAASVLGSKTPALADDAGFAGYDGNANALDVAQGPY